ncbi:MAG: OsmC family protein [bacterium]
MTTPIETQGEAADADGGRWIAARVAAGAYRTDITARTHAFTADEPVALGGRDVGPTPYEYLLGALSACMAMTLRMYADRKGWAVGTIDVQLRTSRSHEPDCKDCETKEVGITRLDRRVTFSGAVTDEQRIRLLQIADRCPVKQTIGRGIAIQSVT